MAVTFNQQIEQISDKQILGLEVTIKDLRAYHPQRLQEKSKYFPK